MIEDYTVLIEYLNPINACEILDENGLIYVEAENYEEAIRNATQYLYDTGFSDDDFCIVNSVQGKFLSLDEFWEARNYLDELMAQEQKQYEEELAWQEYVNENFDFERGDWKY